MGHPRSTWWTVPSFAEKLKELGLGVSLEMVENVTVNEEWFKNL